MKHLLLFVAVLVASLTCGQKIKPATDQERLASHQITRETLIKNSELLGIPFRSVGPSIMSGRVVDIKVNPQKPTEFFVAYASGGLWHTINNGTTFTPLFDHEMVMTIGAFDVNWDTNEIWIGSGEVNSSRSSYAGLGMFYSPDMGLTWEHRGLEQTHHIGRVIIHPNDPKTIYVASLGKLYTQGGGGLFKTTDAGKSWESIFETKNAGIVDAEYVKDKNLLFISVWERHRKAWNFVEAGPETAVWMSEDDGQTWTDLSKMHAFPEGDLIGRIGFDVVLDQNKEWILYACIDNQNASRKQKEEKEEEDELKTDDFKEMSLSAFQNIPDSTWNLFFEETGLSNSYDAGTVKKEIIDGKLETADIYEYFHDANADLFNTPIKGLEIYRLTEKEKAWKNCSNGELENVTYTYGYYFGTISASDQNSSSVYVAGVPILYSADGGENWESRNADNVHVDHHCIWINPRDEKHLILGNDGGINISYDGGLNYIKCNSPAVGQFYSIAVDQAEPYRVYGGLQDNGVWMANSTFEENVGWHQSGENGWKSIMGGDGMRVQIDSRDNSTIYTGYQFGHYSRIKQGEPSHYIHPKHELGEDHLRWNWQTPFIISRHQEDVLYMGSNRFHRSLDKGENWQALSGDLTNGGKEGDVPFGTLTVIHESPLHFGWICVGSDDGFVHVSKDGGQTWTNRSKGLPRGLWISEVMWSEHDENTLLVACNGYRNDHFDAYIYRSEDAGKTWKRIGDNLPKEPVNCLILDSKNPDLLFVGTDHGLYASLDAGMKFMKMQGGLPEAPVHDLVIQNRESELVVATHGRSIWIANIEHLRKPKDAPWLEAPEDYSLSAFNEPWNPWFRQDGPFLTFYIGEITGGTGMITLIDSNGTAIANKSIGYYSGPNEIRWELSELVGEKLDTGVFRLVWRNSDGEELSAEIAFE